MISVVIPTLDAEATLVASLAPLVSGVAEGLVREAVVADGGSTDATREIADAAGCRVISVARGRGAQLAAGAAAARSPWLLFLHADTVLEEGWWREVRSFIERADRQGGEAAASFSFALDDFGARARWLEAAAMARCKLFGLPYGDQGLLISRRLYDRLGGFRPLPLMEDVDLVRRIGRRRLTLLRTRAVTSAARYRRDGYASRAARNALCLGLYFAGVPPARIARLYG
jgi:rSAM/selenodomain-associated transferase 2